MKDITLSRAALVAAFALILMAILAPIADFGILQKIIVPDDAARTSANIVASERSFRWAIVIFMIVAVLDVIVAWALYVFLKPVNASLSLLTAWLRIIYATMLAVVSINLINALQFVSEATYLSSLRVEQLQAHILISLRSFSQGWEIGLIIFGFHLLMLGYLMFKAGFMRRILGVLIMLAALGYLVDGFGMILSASYQVNVAMFTFFGEVVLIFWLLIQGRKVHEMS
jgi:hypothetical protein